MLSIFLISTFPYLILLLFITRHLLKVRPYNPDYQDRINVSVIIPCKNEEDNLPLILHDLSLQDYPPELLEVVVVDDRSTDSTRAIVLSFSNIKNLKLVSNTGSGKKSAIRAGIDASSGKLIITTDADCRAGEKWIKTFASYYSEYKHDMIIGAVSLQGDGSFPGKFQELEFLALQGITAGTATAGSPVMCNGANLAFSREAYLENSGKLHDEIPSGDDIFLMMAMKKNRKYKISWLESPDSVVVTGTKPSVKSFVSQRSRWLSKIKAYNDPFTLITGIVTFVTIIGLMIMFTGMFTDKLNIKYFPAALIIKSIPDLLILCTVTGMRNKRSLLFWFAPVQLFYPFYVLAVSLTSLAGGKKWK